MLDQRLMRMPYGRVFLKAFPLTTKRINWKM
jgi:hypothetical protein